MPGTNSSHTPDAPSERIGKRRPSQRSKSPTTRTLRAFGAQTAKRDAGDALVLARVGAEHLPQALVRPLADEVQVELSEGRQEPIRVVALPVGAIGEVEPEPIGCAGRQARRRAHPQPLAQRIHADRLARAGEQLRGDRLGVECHHAGAARDRVRTQDRVRVVMLAAYQEAVIRLRHHAARRAWTWT